MPAPTKVIAEERLKALVLPAMFEQLPIITAWECATASWVCPVDGSTFETVG